MPTQAELIAERERRRAAAAAASGTAPVAATPASVSMDALIAERERRRVAQTQAPAPAQSNGAGLGPVNPMVAEGRRFQEQAAKSDPMMQMLKPEARTVENYNRASLRSGQEGGAYPLPKPPAPFATPAQRQQVKSEYMAQDTPMLSELEMMKTLRPKEYEERMRELSLMNAASPIPFKNQDGPLELNQERPDQFLGRATGAYVNANIGVANTVGQGVLAASNAYGAAGDPAMGGAMAGLEYGVNVDDAMQRVADAAQQGGYVQNQQAVTDIVPSLPIPAATTAGEMGADVTGNLAAIFTGWGVPLLTGGKAFSEALATVPGLSRTLGRVGVETGENAALAYGMSAGAAPTGSDRNLAGAEGAANPLNYLSIEALRALGRAPGQIDKALKIPDTPTNAGGARPGSVTPQADMLDPAMVPPRATPPQAPTQPQAVPPPPVAQTPPNAPAVTPAPPQPVPTPPAGTLTPVGNGIAVDSYNALPVKTKEGILRALEASGMNRQQAFDAIRSLNDLPPDRANMFEFELIRRYGGPDQYPNLQANLTAMGSDFSMQTGKKGGSPQEVMNKSLLDQAQSEGDYLTRTAEQLFGEGKVATKAELEAFRRQLGGRYRSQLAQTYPGITKLRNQASKNDLGQRVDAARKNLTDYLLRPDVIEQVPPWVQDQVMMQISDDLRWLQKDDAGLQFASRANPELTPLLTSDQTLRYSPQLWRTLVQMYPTQVGHSLQSAYRAAIDDAFSGVSNAIDRTTAKRLMRLRGQSRVRANAADPNKRGVGLLHLIEEASPGYKELRQKYGDVVGAQKAADMPDNFFRVAKDEEALADFVDVYENELTPLQQDAVRNGITTQIRQALKNKTEFTQPWELDAVERGQLPNLTAISSQPFLEALPRVFGETGERMADAIRLSRANIDNIQAINKNFASGTPKGIEIRENARNLYESKAASNINPIDGATSTLAGVGALSAFAPDGAVISAAALGGAAMRAAYAAYKNGKSLSPAQKEALAEWLFKPRRETDAPPPTTPRRFSKAGYAGNVATGALVGGTAGALGSEGDPTTTGQGILAGALGGATRAGLRAVRAERSIIKPPVTRRGNALRGNPPPTVPPPAGPRSIPGQTSRSPAAIGSGLATGGIVGGATYAATGDEDLALKAGIAGAIGGGVLGNRLAKAGKTAPNAPAGRGGAPALAPDRLSTLLGRPSLSFAEKGEAALMMRARGQSDAEIFNAIQVRSDATARFKGRATPEQMRSTVDDLVAKGQRAVQADEGGLGALAAELTDRGDDPVRLLAGPNGPSASEVRNAEARWRAHNSGKPQYMPDDMRAGIEEKLKPGPAGPSRPMGGTSLDVNGVLNREVRNAPASASKPPPVKSGFGSSKPAANALKASPRGPSTASRMVAGGVVGGVAGSLGGDAQAQEDLTGKITETEQTIAELKKAMADLDKITDPFEKQRKLKDLGYYAGKIDGNIAGKTTEGMERLKTKREADLAKAESELTDLMRRDALQRNSPNPYMMALRDYGPTLGFIGGVLGFKFLRGKAATASVATAEAASNKLNKLITKGPVTGPLNKRDENRFANLNTLWKKGGATKDQLPFKQDSVGKYKPNPNAKPAEELFSDNGTWQAITRYVKGKDIAIILGGGVDVAYSQTQIDRVSKDLEKAEKEWEDNPSNETFKRVEDLKNEKAGYEFLQRLGAGIVGGRILGTLGNAYAKPMPNIPGAASEQAKLKQYIAAQKPPPKPRAPRNKLAPPPPPSGGQGQP